MTFSRDTVLSILHGIDAYDFESVVAELWERQGWGTTVTQGSNDRGVDVIAERSDPFTQKIAIQAKRYDPSSSVGGPEVQQYASLRQQVERVDSVVIVTTGQFTRQARETADTLNVKLVNGGKLYNIIEANDAFDVLYPYLNLPDTNETGSSIEGNRSGHGDIPAVSDQDVITTDYENTENERDSTRVPPESLADLIDLQEQIRDEFKQISAIADRVEAAFDTKEFHTVVEMCADGQEELLSLESDVTRYERGFEQADVTATEHLTSPDEFESKLTEQRAQFNRMGSEAKRLAEQADALERLAEEVENDAERAKQSKSEGDEARNRREYDRAKDRYENAMEALRETKETLETYHSLANEYQQAIPADRQEPPADVSLEQLSEELTERIDEEEGCVVERDFQSEATDDSVTNLRMNETHTVAGFTNEAAATYLESDEVPQFCFHSESKGYTHETADGDKERNRPGSDYGCLFLLTDRRVLILNGQDGSDVTTEVTRPTLSEYSIGRLKNRLTLLPDWDDDGEKYHLWIDSSYDEDTLEAAQQYLLPGGEVSDEDTTAPEIDRKQHHAIDSDLSSGADAFGGLSDVSGVGPSKAETLAGAGYDSVEDLKATSQATLADIPGIGNALAARIKADVGEPELGTEGANIDNNQHNDTTRDSEMGDVVRRDAGELPDHSPSEIVSRASGSFSEGILTKTDGRLIEQRLVDYLLPGEKLEYVLWHQYKGLRIIHPDGTEITPHHEMSAKGSRFLLITDRQVCYVAGLDERDEIRTFGYSEMTDVKATSNLMTQWITFSMKVGTEIRFAETGSHADDVTAASEYVRSQIS